MEGILNWDWDVRWSVFTYKFKANQWTNSREWEREVNVHETRKIICLL